MKKLFHFVLWLDSGGEFSEDVEDRLFEAGCDDALLVMYHGRQFIEFDREAGSLLDAVTSALRNVEQCGLKVERIGLYDLVSAADIAKRTERSRASISQLISGKRGPRGFPRPFQGGQKPLWLWPDVKDWFSRYLGEAAQFDDENTDRELQKIDSVFQAVRHVPNATERRRIFKLLESV